MVLQYYLKTGTCKFGATCKFHHPRDKAGIAGRVSLNILGYPLRPVRFFISLYSCYWNWFECANHVRLFISPSLDSPNFGTLISFFLLFHFFFWFVHIIAYEYFALVLSILHTEIKHGFELCIHAGTKCSEKERHGGVIYMQKRIYTWMKFG